MSTKEQTADWRRRRAEIECSIEGCSRGSTAGRGYCPTHYQRWRTGQPLDVVPPERMKRHGSCALDGCESDVYARGWCRLHHMRVLRTGEPGPVRQLKNAAGVGSFDRGYHYVTEGGQRRMSHRVVMERALGRELYPFENVHHRNGQRGQNDLANLELWVKPQPSGQRPEDLVSWVVHFYPDLVRAELRTYEHEQRTGQARLVI